MSGLGLEEKKQRSIENARNWYQEKIDIYGKMTPISEFERVKIGEELNRAYKGLACIQNQEYDWRAEDEELIVNGLPFNADNTI